MTTILGQQPTRIPKLSLTVCFVTWKILLFAIALLSPGPGYDTSTTLLQPAVGDHVRPFVRWDAIYFTQAAQRGYVFEQEWAFSRTMSRFFAFTATYLRMLGASPLDAEPLAGIIVATLSHLVSVLILYELTLTLFRMRSKGKELAFVAACLHVVSPAGLFLSAPYAESSFSMLQFLGYYLYVQAWRAGERGSSLSYSAFMVSSGAAIGLATALRSNGILSGLLFAYDAIQGGWSLLKGKLSVALIRKLFIIVVAGSLVGLGAVVPQVVAYTEYCTSSTIEARPWCSSMPPSIYTFAQSHYWNVGFLRYWTLSNVPLFLLAGPMLFILSISAIWGLQLSNSKPRDLKSASKGAFSSIVPLIALPQAIIVLVTLTTSHVQIVSRLSSGYPVWYWWLASTMVTEGQLAGTGKWIKPKTVVRWMVMYALIQGGLFASFLPPA